MTDGSVEVDDLTSAVSEPIAAPAHLEAARVQMRSRSGDGRRGGRVRSATVTISSGSETIIEFTKAFDEIENVRSICVYFQRVEAIDRLHRNERRGLFQANRRLFALVDYERCEKLVCVLQQTNLTEAQKLPEARRKILAILDAKEKQWNSKNVAAPSAVRFNFCRRKFLVRPTF